MGRGRPDGPALRDLADGARDQRHPRQQDRHLDDSPTRRRQRAHAIRDILEVLSGSDLTIAKLKDLQQALARARAKAAADPEAAIQEVERVNPAVGNVVRQYWDSLDTTQKLAATSIGTTVGMSALSAFLLVLMNILTIVAADRRELRGQPSEERIQQIIEQQMHEGWQEDPLLPRPSAPEPLRGISPTDPPAGSPR